MVDRIRANLESVRGSILVTFIGDTIELVPHPSEVHSWSPQLRLDLSESGSGTLIHGRFAPHPHVWLMYLGIHSVGALGTLGAVMFGISQWLTHQTPWALWALPTLPVLALSLIHISPRPERRRSGRRCRGP